MKSKSGLISLSPLLLFLVLYVSASVLAGDFYVIPMSAVFVLSCIYAVTISKGTLRERLDAFSKGAGNPDILMMIWIFILAGAFARIAKDMGAVEATVNLTLSVVPPRMLFAGLFLTACFISMAVGTSVGTIVAISPIAAGLAEASGQSTAYMAAIIVGGAFFGDNLSFISDTTIAATRAVGCEMRDKFKSNIIIIAPAVLIVTAIYLCQGWGLEVSAPSLTGQWLRLVPYILVIILALSGINVMLILCLGIAAAALIGFIYGSFSWTSLLVSAGNGISGMSDLIIVTILACGMLELIRRGGGLDLIFEVLTKNVHGKTGAQFCIAFLVSIANLCTANNTIAIITTGGIADDISKRFKISPRKTASLLDTFSCFVQGLIPYGAQILMAAGLCGVAPTAIIPFLYYPLFIGIFAVLSIVFNYPK